MENVRQVEKSSCGVGFLVSLKNQSSHQTLLDGLHALKCVEHRGGCGSDGHLSDGSGIMTAIPYEIFGLEKETFAVASLFIPVSPEKQKIALRVFEETFAHLGLDVQSYREVPIDESILSPMAQANRPVFKHAIIKRPKHCRTLSSFDKLLYMARQMTRTKEKESGIYQEFYFTSLSSRTIVYKALCVSHDLEKFYLDLQDPRFKTNFTLFHRRFSTNTITSWDKIQPFRLIAHNGEINTIEGNKAWSITREKSLGLREDELITNRGISDSGSLNNIVEGLKNRSSIPQTSEILSILMPPAHKSNPYYNFWSRGMEPWDGPALVVYSDGKNIGARLDRNGFRPCRWTITQDFVYLCSETGTFVIEEERIIQKGALFAGGCISVNALSGQYNFLDSSQLPDNKGTFFEANLHNFEYVSPSNKHTHHLKNCALFSYSKEDVDKFLYPMIKNLNEPIGSMGDTGRLACLSDLPRSFFDFFYQDFAQVTNPPLDYIREKAVTDMRVFLGRKPNIFEPKELIPPKISLSVEGPVLSLGQIDRLLENYLDHSALQAKVIDCLFQADANKEQFIATLNHITTTAIDSVKQGYSIIILSDRKADPQMLPIPSILSLRAVNLGLNRTGRRMRTSIVIDSGDIKNSHHIACLMGYGATAVCPYLLIEQALYGESSELQQYFPKEREQRLITTLTSGVLKIMAKMGISVLRSYQGSQLFSIIGLGQEVLDFFFPKEKSLLGGLSMQGLVDKIKNDALSGLDQSYKNLFLYKEHASGKMGEQHALTTARSKIIHRLTQETDGAKAEQLYESFKSEVGNSAISFRDLLDVVKIDSKLDISKVEETTSILTTFGSGGMSFGAISAEAQRDLILAFKQIGGRCNSGEGGENPYYYTEGISANVKQIASGRFGVTAEYLISGEEVQIKIAQGAKPGEGGQLMAIKITDDIARARHSSTGIDLISPPPQHDIYSIEDLKQLIYELKQLNPDLLVSVKLVSGKNIGAIAVGVVKAGADIIQVSGGNGGTGAASLLSMKHAGLPLEIGLPEVHRALVTNNLRDQVLLRADGGLAIGRDIVIAAILGADQFDFGKMVLVAEGCIMARVCEKNTCPTGIATQNPHFKQKYQGNKDKIVSYLQFLAKDIQNILAQVGVSHLSKLKGRSDLLTVNSKFQNLIAKNEIDLTFFRTPSIPACNFKGFKKDVAANSLNLKIIEAIEKDGKIEAHLVNTDRAIPCSLSGLMAAKSVRQHLSHFELKWRAPIAIETAQIKLKGQAGQGFGSFLVSGISLLLEGEANDSVAKGMSGGDVVIVPPPHSNFEPASNTIIGNVALYGATGGLLYAYGMGGDRFAVRNSGATAIIEGVGIHACEYMTGGKIIILGRTQGNIGAGMTGGIVYLPPSEIEQVNLSYLKHVPMLNEDVTFLKNIIQDYYSKTKSVTAQEILENQTNFEKFLHKFVPLNFCST